MTDLIIRKPTYRKQIGIVLRGGASSGEVFTDCADILITGRTFKSLPGLVNNYGLSFTRCRNIRILDCDFEGFGRGVVFSQCDGFLLAASRFRGQKIDGVNIAQSWNGVVADNDFTDPDTGEAHPDAIQLWSRPTAPPTSDISIVRNRIKGAATQGITAFNHTREGVDDGGFDRLFIGWNDIEVGMPQAISAMSARDSWAVRNTVRTFAGARWRASLNTGPGVVRSGNTVAAGAGRAAAND